MDSLGMPAENIATSPQADVIICLRGLYKLRRLFSYHQLGSVSIKTSIIKACIKTHVKNAKKC